MPKPARLEELLRQALNNLYDSASLRASPLVTLLGLGHCPNTARALRNALEQAIEELGELEISPAKEATERTYQVLFNRYIQQFTQLDVANQLGISPRHLRREQADALRILAGYIEEKYQLGDTTANESRPDSFGLRDGILDKELGWLGTSLCEQTADVDDAIEDAIATARPLGAAHGALLAKGASTDIPHIAIDYTILKQILLNLLATAIQTNLCRTLVVSAANQPGQIVIEVAANPENKNSEVHWIWDDVKVGITRQLLARFDGELAVDVDRNSLVFTISLPSAETVQLLVIEDNHDTLQLWQRYLESTRYQIVVVNEAHATLETAEKVMPDIVLLDVMLPGIDGWELLTRLRHHQSTAHIPIIVCTVLPQRELALSLGASDFIAKPTSRKDLLSVLAHCSVVREP